jgi:hypothetical protein
VGAIALLNLISRKKMIVKLYNNDGSDHVIYEGQTAGEIREKAKYRINLPEWKKGWSEVVKP